MEGLKQSVADYLEISKKLAEVNAQVKELRDERRTIELDLAATYNEHGGDQFPEKIPLTTSEMLFVVKKPGTYKKSWSLNKTKLKEYLLDILPEHGEDVFNEILRRYEPTLTETDYSFELRPMKKKEED